MNYKNEIEINVINDILTEPMAMGPRLGKEVNSVLNKMFDSYTELTLVHLNLRDSNPIDYLFTREAVRTIFSETNTSSHLDIIYYVESTYQRWNLIKGILYAINPDFSPEGSIEEQFLRQNLHMKLSISNQIDFLANLSDNEKNILDEINKQKSIKTYDLIELFKSKIEVHEITSAIADLKSKKFVYCVGDKTTELLNSINLKMKKYE